MRGTEVRGENLFWVALCALVLCAVIAATTSCTSLPVKPVPAPAPSPAPVPSPAPAPPPAGSGISVADGYAMPIDGWQPQYEAIIRALLPASLLSADGMSDYCPSYSKLADKPAFWVALIHWDTSYESGWHRTDQYVETGLDIDRITGKQTVSEGLEQLSYGDQLNYPYAYCKMMNYASDKSLPLAQRSIMNPVVNLGCTLEIFAYRVAKYPGQLHTRSSLGAYWSTMRATSDDKNGHMQDIVAHIKKDLPACFQ